MVQDLEKICSTLDKLTLDSLTLMEQHIQSKINLETIMSEGDSHIVKARYIMGQNKVSQLQLPGEDANEFEAISVVNENDDVDVKFDLQQRKKEELGDSYQNPLRWFGLLVPNSLQSAQKRYKNALQQAVKCTNVQVRLGETLEAIDKLNRAKQQLKCEE